MTRISPRDLRQAVTSGGRVDAGTHGPRPRNDAQLGVDELRALRLDVDVVASPKAAAPADPLVDVFRGSITSGDHLRLPPLKSSNNDQLRRSIERILAANPTASASGTPDEREQEAKMRALLGTLREVADSIQRQTGLRREG